MSDKVTRMSMQELHESIGFEDAPKRKYRLQPFEAFSRGKGDYRQLEIDLLDDGTLYVDAEDDSERVTLYLDQSDLKRLAAWCDAALSRLDTE